MGNRYHRYFFLFDNIIIRLQFSLFIISCFYSNLEEANHIIYLVPIHHSKGLLLEENEVYYNLDRQYMNIPLFLPQKAIVYEFKDSHVNFHKAPRRSLPICNS